MCGKNNWIDQTLSDAATKETKIVEFHVVFVVVPKKNSVQSRANQLCKEGSAMLYKSKQRAGQLIRPTLHPIVIIVICSTIVNILYVDNF